LRLARQVIGRKKG